MTPPTAVGDYLPSTRSERRLPIDRLFFALFPDADAAARIVNLARALRDALGLKGKPMRAERLHVTVCFLGDHPGLPEDLVASAIAAAERLEHPVFDVAFDRAGSLRGRRRNQPLVLSGTEGLAGLCGFEQALIGQLELAGIARAEDQPFTPHVTLLYDDRTIALQPVEPIRWRVREVVLVHSLVGTRDYRVLGRWALKDFSQESEAGLQ